MTDADRKRAILMLELAAEYIENHYPDGTLFYDGTDCDGYCVADECRIAASLLKVDGE